MRAAVFSTHRMSKVYTLELGCCQACTTPFDSQLLNPPALKETYSDIPVRFRSYRFWRDFMALNGKRSDKQRTRVRPWWGIVLSGGPASLADLSVNFSNRA